jgi:hypothetical protein
MAMARAGRGPDLSELQHQMAQIRHEMHEDVREAVRGAQSLTDWRSMVANHPWTALGLATALGFLLVPARRTRRADRVRLEEFAESREAQATYPPRASPVAGPSVLRSALRLVTPVLVRAAQNYALNQVEQWLASNLTRFNEDAADRRGERVQAAPAGQNLVVPTIPFRDPR